jgi:hypothetical protein
VTEVVVNEARLLAVGGRACQVWWEFLAYRPHEVTVPSPGGSRVIVPCDDREHAEWLRGWLVGIGVPTSAISLRRAEGNR